MVAKDLALQGYSADGQRTSATAICCLEVIVRFHIVAAHDCCEAPANDFDARMNWSSLSGYVSSLDQLYTLARQQQPLAVANVWCVNEPTMRAYMLLAMLPPPLRFWRTNMDQHPMHVKALTRIQTLLVDALNHRHCLSHQVFTDAIQVCQAFLSEDYATFFNIARTCTDILFLSGLHAQFSYMRVRALQSINFALYILIVFIFKLNILTIPKLLFINLIASSLNIMIQCLNIGDKHVGLEGQHTRFKIG